MEHSLELLFGQYEAKFKALADRRRLQILHMLRQNGTMCVCDLVDVMGIPQSKLSYHLKILLDAGFIIKETKGTWSYYSLHQEEIAQLLSEKLCRHFCPSL
jgi:ArsR family transcriptional regulator, arsenate/arsenite/antimonite-responsive transcriptional repressor